MRSVEIQEFDESDAAYEKWCAISNAVNPDNPFTAQEMKHWDAQREARIQYGKWFGVVEGEAVGVVEFSWEVQGGSDGDRNPGRARRKTGKQASRD